MPIIPALVCMSTGCVAQWYMKTPGCLATKRIVSFLPGAMSTYFLCGATSAEWKSIEWAMLTAIFFEPPLTNVTWTLSPWLTTIGGVAAVPRYAVPLTAKLQASVGASCGSTCVTCWKTSTVNFFTGPAGTAGSVGSTRWNCSKSMPLAAASVGAFAAAGAAAGAAARLTIVVVVSEPACASANAPRTMAEDRREAGEPGGHKRPLAPGALPLRGRPRDPFGGVVVKTLGGALALGLGVEVGGHVCCSCGRGASLPG